jgi:hypothetical protein
VNELNEAKIPLLAVMQGGEYALFRFIHTCSDRPRFSRQSRKFGRIPKMKRLAVFAFVVLCWAAVIPERLAAQDLVITNVRIIVGNGTVVDRGSLTIRGGRISSVTAGPANESGILAIDAHGMTALSGFIDAHRHINTGPNEKKQMQELLDAGYTTVLSGGGPAEGNLTLRDHIEKGVIKGPRIIPSGSIRLTLTPEEARAEVRKLAQMGIKFTGEIGLTPKPGPTPKEIETLKAIVDSQNKLGFGFRFTPSARRR